MSCQFWVGVPTILFNIMTHLLVHLVEEIYILGPVFIHNTFPFEGFMGVLKKYVRNRARPEGSITKGYVTEEVIEFCVDSLSRLVCLNRDMRRDWVEKAGSESRQWYVGTGILSLKHTTQFYKIPSWWLRTSSNTRILYAPKTRGSLTPGLNLKTRRLSAVGYENRNSNAF